MSLFNDIKDLFVKPSAKRLMEKEIDESERLLLQAHTNTEHWQSQVEYHTKKLKRLRTSWNKLTEEPKDA
jgi:hypothetical protein